MSCDNYQGRMDARARAQQPSTLRMRPLEIFVCRGLSLRHIVPVMSKRRDGRIDIFSSAVDASERPVFR
jgi:hypothetical protein